MYVFCFWPFFPFHFLNSFFFNKAILGQEPHTAQPGDATATEQLQPQQEQHEQEVRHQQAGLLASVHQQPPTEYTGPSEPTPENEQQNVDATSPASPASADSAEAVPHARGPPVVGVEDVGLQNGKGVEMTLSTKESGDPNAGAAGAAAAVAAVSESNAAHSGQSEVGQGEGEGGEGGGSHNANGDDNSVPGEEGKNDQKSPAND